MTQHSRDTVISFINALNAEDFHTARNYVSDEIAFIGVLGTRHGADAYFVDMEKMKFKYKIEMTVAENNDVCLWYAISIGGKTITACGWYHLANGKISEFRVLFDPRPLL